jgi:hypothetical protein
MAEMQSFVAVRVKNRNFARALERRVGGPRFGKPAQEHGQPAINAIYVESAIFVMLARR